MSKKLLAALIALSMVGAYACGGDDDNSDAGCKVAAKQCDGNKIQVCNAKGAWVDAQVCSNGCSNGECVAVPGCNIEAKTAECTAAGKDFDTTTCDCKEKEVVPTCDTDAVTATCLAQGKEFDAANCACKNGSGPVVDPTEEVDPSAPCDESSYAGECSKDGKTGYYCKDGAKVAKTCKDNEVCEVKGGNSVQCNDPGAETCTKETYKGRCSEDLMSGSYCNGSTVVNVTCSAEKPCTDNNGFIKCQESGGATEDCAPGGTAYCNKVCKADGSEGYYYSGGKVNTQKCPNNDCNIANNRVNCGSGSVNTEANPQNMDRTKDGACDKAAYYGACSDDFTKRYYCSNDGKIVEYDCSSKGACDPASLGNNSSKCKEGGTKPATCEGEKVKTAGAVGACCDKSEYTQTCTNDGKNALVCWDDQVKQWNCTSCEAAGYNPEKPLQVNCVSGGEDAGEACVYGTDKPKCVGQDLMICGNSNKYYKKETCTTDKPCNVDKKTGWGSCGVTDDCKLGQFESSCGSDNNTSTYCSTQGKVSTKACAPDKPCTLCADGYVGCNVDCTQDGHDKKCVGDTKLTEGGDENACCDPLTYKAVCSDAKDSVTYCSSVGKVKIKACKNDCAVTSNTNYTCTEVK